MLRRRVYTFISFPVFIFLYSYTAVGVLLGLIISYLRWKKAIFILMSLWAKSVFPLMGKRLHIVGRENLDKKKKYILLANHASMFDITAIMSLLHGISWFGHERLLKIPLFGKMLMMTDYVPMSNATVTNTRRMLRQLEEKSANRTIAIFPEGTRTLNGKINPFFRGFIYLLRASEKDILPVTLNGFFKLKPKNRFHINFGSKLGIVIHEPLNGKQLARLDDIEILDKVKTVIESASTDS